MADVERNKNGTIKGISTMGDFVKNELTEAQKEINRKKSELEKKYEH